MDQIGAAGLLWRIEQHTHWQQAAAVREGRQSRTDPERDDVEAIAEGIRLYTPRTLNGNRLQPCKRLVDGIWVSGIAGPDEADIAGAARQRPDAHSATDPSQPPNADRSRM